MEIHPFNQEYKNRILNAPYDICIERARYYTESYKKTEGEHPALRAAKAFQHTLNNMTISIFDGEQIVGNRSGKLVGVVIPVERGDVNIILELELEFLLKRKRQPFHIDENDKRELYKDILPYWRKKTVRDRKKSAWKKNGINFNPALHPLSLYRRYRSLNMKKLRNETAVPGVGISYMLKGMKEALHNNPALVMNVFDVQGHLILGHKNILHEGFASVREHSLQILKNIQNNNDRDGTAFLESVIICCDAIGEFAERFAKKAEELSDKADSEREKSLLEIAERCRRVPMNPPRNFHEAVQSLWLTQVGALVAYGMAGIIAIGRFDQYLYPFFKEDKSMGQITDKEATGLMEELLIKLSSNLMVLPYIGKNTGNELGSDSCVPTVGGIDVNGEDAVNGLSYLILNAFTNVKSMGNSFSIRLSEKSPDEFWKKALQTYRRTSGAALFSDEMIIKALVNGGMNENDARDYGIIGCVEPTGDGNTFGCTSGNDISFTAALEMALNNGYLRIMGKRIGAKTGDPRKFHTFERFMDAFKEQVLFMINTIVTAVNLKDQIYMDEFPCPFISSTLSGCIENARDMTSGGATYNFGSISARGLGTAVDSLAAIKYFVYEKKIFSMGHLLKMLNSNFKGEKVARTKLLNRAAKYGSDDDYADEIAKEISGFFCSEVSKKKTIRGGFFRPSFFSYGMHVLEGLYLGATPNGRLAGEPVSNSLSPSNGSEKKGPTAMLRSVSKIDHSLISNGCAINLKLLPSMFEGEERLEKMVGLVKGFFLQGGMELQPNVVSNKILKDAQKNPENYRDLVIRVSGYSAIFTDLGRSIQDEIITRTEFSAL